MSVCKNVIWNFVGASFEKSSRETEEEFVSRFSQQWKYIQKPVGQYSSFWVQRKRSWFQLAKLSFQYFKSKQTQTGLDNYEGHTRKWTWYNFFIDGNATGMKERNT